MGKKILITGGAGFIGSNLAKKLIKGSRVFVIDNFSDYYNPEIKRENIKALKNFKNFKCFKADIRNKNSINRILKQVKPHTLIHLAGEVGVRPSVERTADYIHTNIVGTDNLIKAANKNRVKQIIFGSSSSVYGKRSDRKAFKETDACEPVSPYAMTKLAAENLLRINAKSQGTATTVLRFFTVYGPGNRPDMACFAFTQSIDRGKEISIFGRGTKRDFTYINDIVDGIKKAIDRLFMFEIINLGSGKPVTVNALVELLEKNLHKKAKITRAQLPEGDVPATIANNRKAKKVLRWQPKTNINQGVEKLVRWYLKI